MNPCYNIAMSAGAGSGGLKHLFSSSKFMRGRASRIFSGAKNITFVGNILSPSFPSFLKLDGSSDNHPSALALGDATSSIDTYKDTLIAAEKL